MKKRFTKIACLTLGLLFGGFSVSSCSFIGDDPYSISNVDQYFDEDGNKWIKILFTDDDIPPVNVQIPRGEQGVAGNGVKNVTSEIKDGHVEIKITYTDTEIPEDIIKVPVKNGVDGVGIQDVTQSIDEETGTKHIKITFTDGRDAFEFDVPKGDKGVGIKDIVPGEKNEFGELEISIILDDGRVVTVNVPAGEKGRGIHTIDYEETDDEYILIIVYTDAEEERITFKKPKSSEWHYGSETPNINLGKIGDFYFNTNDGTIWSKIADPNFIPSDDPFNPTKDKGIWKLIFKVDGISGGEEPVVRHIVKFDANGGVLSEDAGGVAIDRVNHGETLDFIPTAVKPGHDFIGWYTDKVINVNSGKLTYTTPITKDWTFYAQFTPTKA